MPAASPLAVRKGCAFPSCENTHQPPPRRLEGIAFQARGGEIIIGLGRKGEPFASGAAEPREPVREFANLDSPGQRPPLQVMPSSSGEKVLDAGVTRHGVQVHCHTQSRRSGMAVCRRHSTSTSTARLSIKGEPVKYSTRSISGNAEASCRSAASPKRYSIRAESCARRFHAPSSQCGATH